MSTLSTNILIFSPHPDDDVLACGGTIVHRLREGHRIFIIYMTDGRYSHSDHRMEKIPGCPTPEELREIRHTMIRMRIPSICHVYNKYSMPFSQPVSSGYLSADPLVSHRL